MAEPNLSELLAELNRNQLLLNNLFQLDNGKFRASVRRLNDRTAFSFYDHPNPGAAILGAIANAGAAVGTPLRENRMRVRGAPKPEKIAGSGLDLLTKLGLKK